MTKTAAEKAMKESWVVTGNVHRLPQRERTPLPLDEARKLAAEKRARGLDARLVRVWGRWTVVCF